jgi:NAD(P)-dependent dehydrogenase (short-subunit alcohol dehydrogenase family)
MKIAIVTGANRGIGLETCRQLAATGFKVILTARNEEKGKVAADTLSEKNPGVQFYTLDVTSEKSIQSLTQFIEQEFGKLDVLVNNAGISFGNKSISSASVDEIRRIMETNFFGPLMVTKTLLPLLKKSDDARVINVSSGMGAWNSLDGSYAGYRLSKVSLNALTVMFANDLRGTAIKVNTISPGWVRTEMGGNYAPDSVEQGADTIVWLATAKNIPTGKFFSNRKEIPF